MTKSMRRGWRGSFGRAAVIVAVMTALGGASMGQAFAYDRHDDRARWEHERIDRERWDREHRYGAPPVVVAPPAVYAPPPVVMAPPSGLSVVLPINIR